MPKNSFDEFNLDPALAEAVETTPAEETIEGILRLEDPNEIPPHFSVVSRFNRICTGRFQAAHTLSIRQHPNVISLKAARPIGVSYDDEELTAPELPREIETQNGQTSPFAGRRCIVAALDFGLDFAHPNFLNPDGTTRLLAFWHQGADYDAEHPNRYGYGRIFSSEEINAALNFPDPYHALGYHPAISDTGSGSHGTHTLDIAAGNGRAGRAGSGSRADLMFVHLSTPSLGAVGDLGDSVRMLEGLDYVDRTALGRPWVVNLSVGRTAGSHDGTSLVEQGMHELLRTGPDKAICQSAGNYQSANLAVHGWLRDGEDRELDWIVDPEDTTDNELDVWYSGKDRFVIAIRPPQGAAFVEAKLGDVADIVHEGAVVGRLYHRRNDPNNRDNHVEVFMYPGAPHGVWTLRLTGEYVISGRFHSWIERDLARPGAQSRFDARITSRSYTLGTIATSPLVITVGAYDAGVEGTPLAPFSSCGPTRDERRDKPELLAPGVGVVAARSIPRGSIRQEGLLVARSGTSMATPHVTGAVAAMLEAADRPISIDEIRDCLRRSAEPVMGGQQAGCCGWGLLNVAGAIREIRGSEITDSLQILSPIGALDVLSEAAPTFEVPVMNVEITGHISISSQETAQEASMYEDTSLTNSTADDLLDRAELASHHLGADRYLEQAEDALTNAVGERRRSEASFLQCLLRELGGDVAATGLSPADLFRSMVSKDRMHSERGALEVLARPSQRLEGTLRPGDWILRAVPGTGDVGHISVLASDDLLTPYELESEGIDAESRQPGQYGLVIEAGAFPHCRSRPYARRILDSHGRVPPHALILRPSLVGSDIDTEDTKAPADTRKGITFSSESKISAADMLKKINASKKLESWMKSAVSVKGNLLSGSTRFTLPKGKTVPRWFQLFLDTALSNTTHVTTGEVRMDKDGVRLVGDFEPNDFPGNMVTTGKGGQKTFIGFANIPDKYADNVITLGFWHHEMVDEGAGWDGKNGLRSVERRVVVIGNRQAFGKETLGIDDEKILETFFHEVSAHRGVHDHIEFNEPKVSEKDRLIRSQHSIRWVTTRTPDPAIDSDVVAKEVEDFFGTKIDRTLYDKAKKAGGAIKAGSGTTGEALEPSPQRPFQPSQLPGQPTGPLQPGQPSLPQQEIRRTVTVDLSANTPSTRAFRPERNDKSGVIELVAAVRYGSLVPANVTFRWRSEPPDAVGFGNQALQPAQGPTNIRVPVFARRPGRARVFLEALNAQRQVIESSSITLSVPQFFVVTDSQLRDLPRITDNRQINQPATLDSALQQLGLLNDKEQIFSMVQGAVERIAGPRAAGTANGCSRVYNVRFIWRLSAQPDAVPAGLPAHLFTQVDLQGYPPVQLGTLFGNTTPAHPGAQNSAENPAELITVFAGMFELLTRENTTARDNTREEKDLRARLKTVGAYWRRNQNDACARAFMRTILSRAMANTICHELYHSLLTIRADERGAGRQAFDPGGHLREPGILSINRDFNARTGVRVTDETRFPASRSYVIEEIGIGPWQTLPDVYDRRIWEFFPTPPQWPSVVPGQVLHEDVEEEKPPKPVPARGTFSVAALKDGGYLYRFNGEDVLSWKDRAATAVTYYLTDNFPGITGPVLSALVKELAPSITINSTDPKIKAANYLDLTFDAGVETTIRQRMKKQYPQFPPSRPQQGTRTLADPDKAAKAGKPPTNAPTQQPTPTPPPDKPLELTKDDQKLLDELAKVTQGAKSKTKIDPKELVRLYKLVKDAVKDPVFDQKGESMVRFAKFLQLNKDKIEGMIASGSRGNLTQDQLEKIIAEYEKFVGAEPVDKDPDKPLETVENYNKEFEYDEGWQKLSKLDRQLLVDYARLKPEDITDKKVDFKKVPTSLKVSMALKLSDKSFLGELKDAAEDAFSDPTFIITLVVMMAIYVGLWLTPDPTFITKLAAGALTVALLLQFAWDDIIGTVRAWGDLKDDCDVSFDVAQLRQAGNKFMKKLGKTGFDILMFIVMWRVGKRVSPKVQKIGARRGVVRAEAKLTAAEAQPGSGKPPQAPPGTADLLGKARAAVTEPSNPTAVLDALAKQLTGDAQSGLAKFRQSVGDQTAMRAIQSTSSQGLDVKNFLTSKGMTEAAIKAAKADVVKAKVAAARAKLIEAETIKDPAMRAKARAEQFKALIEILNEHGILSDAKVQKGITSRNMDDLISAIGEAIARTTIRGRAKFAGKKNFKMRTNLAVVRDFPGYKSIAEWRAAEKARANAQPNPPEPKTLEKDLSRRAAKLFEKDGKVYEGVGEIDVMMVEEVKGGKPRPVELSEIKTGQEKASQASDQIDKSIGGLADIAAKKPGVYFFELAAKNKLGKDISTAFDLSRISTVDKSTFGLQGRQGFSDSLGISEEAIIGLAESLIKSLPPSGQTPALPPTKKDDAE